MIFVFLFLAAMFLFSSRHPVAGSACLVVSVLSLLAYL